MKNTVYTILIITMNLIFTTGLITAQDVVTEETTEPTLNLSGSVDSYFRSNLNADFDQSPGTSFANLTGFSLGMVNLVLDQEGKNFGFVADLVFGPRGEDATFLSPELRPGGSSNIVNQLNAYWKVSDAVTLTIGNFNTFLGYEVISPKDNFNYSTTYLFSYGPFSHTGLKADFDLGGGFSLMAGVFNPTDATEFNPVNEFAGGAQIGYEGSGLGIWLNGLFSDGFSQFDITAGYDVTDAFYLGLNASAASDAFTGIAGYAQYAASDNLKFGARVENFTADVASGILSPDGDNDGSVLDLTFSANYSVGKLTFIPEFRMDTFSSEIIPNDGETSKTLSSFVLAAVYDF